MRAPVRVALLVLLGVAPLAHGGICLSDDAPHPCDSVRACEDALRADATDAAARLKLCDLHVDREEFVEAAVVVRRGVQACTDGRRICSLLNLALSNVEEQRVARERDRGAEANRRRRAALRGYCLGGVTTDRTISACEELVADQPEAPLFAALVEKLLRTERPARALDVLQDARSAGVSAPRLDALEADARARRADAVEACVSGDRLEVCDAALLASAPNEPELLRALGRLLAASGSMDAAFRSLAAAFRRSEDAATATLIAELDPDAFAGDENFRRVRERALRVLGRGVAPTPRETEVAAAAGDAPAAADDVDGAALVAISEPTPEPPPPASVSASLDETLPGDAAAETSAAGAIAFSNRLLPDGRTH
ncbi:MAG: hypothetical protein V2J24_16265 [Pseudomonadales bacterium]|jgi:hypothetical protein|nr:hypothetical protein [Pseudomonadales bacterium]